MEKAVEFRSEGTRVRGILHVSEGSAGSLTGLGVVFLHGWSGCRLGPHRMFVKMARRLAEDGCSCLRFDFRGRGESDGETEKGTIETMTADAIAAAAFLRDGAEVKKTVFLGICSGGKVAIAAAVRTSTVDGLVLWSCESMGSIKSPAVNGRKTVHALRLYARKLLHLETWKKILLGRVDAASVQKAVRGHETADAAELAREDDVLEAFSSYRGTAQFIYGENDPETKIAWKGYKALCERVGIPAEFHLVAEANHSYYAVRWEEEVMAQTQEWLKARQAG